MEKNKLVYFLRLLSPEELKEFKWYLSSPLFNRRESLKNLLEVLVEEFLVKESNISREEVYLMVYGDKPFNNQSLKTIMTQLQKAFCNFLAFKGFQNDPINQQRYFLDQLMITGDQKYFPTYYKRATRELNAQPLDSAVRYLEMMQLGEMFHRYNQSRPGRDPQNHLAEAERNMLASFLIRLLRYELRELSRSGTFKQTPDSILKMAIVETVAAQLTEMPSVVQVYSLMVSCFKDLSKPEHFIKAKATLLNFWQDFSREEAIDLFLVAISYAADRVNGGKNEFLKELFELYQAMLFNSLLVEDGKLSPFHFKNIVNVGLRLKKFSWVEKFLEKWQNSIYPDHAENAYHYNYGMLFFYRKEYIKAQSHFHKVLQEYKDIFYGLNSRGYLLQIYYELQDINSLESLSNSFRIFISRHKEISDVKRQHYLSFLNHLSKMCDIPSNDSKKLNALRAKILEKEHKGMGVNWLLEKIDNKIKT